MNHDEREDDFDDEFETDELEYEEEYSGGILRWLSIVFVVAAIGGFVALAWYAYKSGMEPVSEDEIPMVAADSSPYKATPSDPGGLQFEHQDKSVYNQLATGNSTERPMAERLLPRPEEPVERAQPETPVAPEEFTKEPVETIGGSEVVETPIPSTTKQGEGASVEVVEVMEVPVATAPDAKPAEPTPAPTPAPAPAPVKPETPPAPVAQPVTPAPAMAQPPASGQFMAQLGAFSSKNDAEAAWAKVSAAHGSMFPTKGHVLQQAIVDGKTFHRLQIGPFESDASARKVCSHLQQNNQPCFVVSVK